MTSRDFGRCQVRGSVFGLLLALAVAPTWAQSMTVKTQRGLPAISASVDVAGQPHQVWKCDKNAQALMFQPTPALSGGRTLYLKVSYLDVGYGRLSVQIQGATPIKPDRHLGLTLNDTRQVVNAFMRMPNVPVLKPGAAVRVTFDRWGENPLQIESLTVQETPFSDPHFQYILSDPWLSPYNGPRVAPADNTTLKGKVMVGYQGWFSTPNDPKGGGWVHWGDMTNSHFNIDVWPDLTGYPANCLIKACDIKTLSGKNAYLFSSAWPEVTDLHFSWMRTHDIDGAFVQRFLGANLASLDGSAEWVLANARAAANRHGRLWAIEYDISSARDDNALMRIKTDWAWMIDTFKIGSDPAYAREKSKLVVFVWGMPIPDRKISVNTANQIVDFFKNDPKYGGNYVIGGIPGNYRTLDASWIDHIKKYDAAQPWMSSSYDKDMADFAQMGVTYVGHAKPGFSWAHLMHIPTGSKKAYTAREGGAYYWSLLQKAAQAKVDRMCIGMYDEYDEGTAIMPLSSDPPATPVVKGLTAQFYPDVKGTGHGTARPLPQISCDFGAAPLVKGIPATGFKIRFNATLQRPTPGEYRFFLEGPEGDSATLLINDAKVLGVASFKGAKVGGKPISMLSDETKTLQLDYIHQSQSGRMQLCWEGPGIPYQVIPESAFIDAWGRFVTPEGHPADWYLQLTRKGKQMLLGKMPADSPMPTENP